MLGVFVMMFVGSLASPSTASDYYELARAYLDAGNRFAAKMFVEKGLNIAETPSVKAKLKVLGAILSIDGEEKVKFLTDVYSDKNLRILTRVYALVEAMKILSSLGRYPDAVKMGLDFLKANQVEGDIRKKITVEIGKVYFLAGFYEKSAECLQLSEKPEDTFLFGLSLLRLGGERERKAVEVFKSIKSYVLSSPDRIFAVAKTYEKIGELEKANWLYSALRNRFPLAPESAVSVPFASRVKKVSPEWVEGVEPPKKGFYVVIDGIETAEKMEKIKKFLESKGFTVRAGRNEKGLLVKFGPFKTKDEARRNLEKIKDQVKNM